LEDSQYSRILVVDSSDDREVTTTALRFDGWHVVEAQTQYSQRAFDAYTSEWTKLGEMTVGMVRDASKPVENASRRS